MDSSKFNYELPDLSKLTAEDIEGNTPLQDYLTKQLFSLLTQKTNLHGRRVGKAKDAINPGDYVTKRQVASNLFGTLAVRPPPNSVTAGTTYFATDRTVTYISINGHWVYRDGIQRGLLAAKPSPSVLYDSGYRYYATDYDWEYVWNLITWERVGGANLYIQGFKTAPTKAGWGLCDGSTYTASTDSGGTTSVTTPNATSVPKFCKFGSIYDDEISAIVPTITGSTGNAGGHNHTLTPLGSLSGSVTGDIPEHTHDATDTYTGPPKTSGGAGSWGTTSHFDVGVDGTCDVSGTTDNTDLNHNHGFTVNSAVTSGPSTTTFVFDDGPVDVASNSHTHTVTYSSNTDSALGNHNHGFTGSGTISATGSVATNTEHYHIVDFPTAGITGGPFPLTLTNTMAFTGSITTTSSVGDHAHAGSSLTISNTGEPIAVQLIPYIRL